MNILAIVGALRWSVFFLLGNFVFSPARCINHFTARLVLTHKRLNDDLGAKQTSKCIILTFTVNQVIWAKLAVQIEILGLVYYHALKRLVQELGDHFEFLIFLNHIYL